MDKIERMIEQELEEGIDSQMTRLLKDTYYMDVGEFVSNLMQIVEREAENESDITEKGWLERTAKVLDDARKRIISL